MVFSAIVLMQMANAFECRSTPASLFSIGPLSNRLLVGAVAVEALVLLAFVYLPPVQRVLGHHPLDVAQWALVLITPFLLLGAEEARKAIVRARARTVTGNVVECSAHRHRSRDRAFWPFHRRVSRWM